MTEYRSSLAEALGPWTGGGRRGLALSGGLDSMVLAHALWTLGGYASRKTDLPLAIHVCHHLRPADELERETKLIRDFCLALGLPLVLVHLEAASLREAARGRGLEAAARQGRYAALAAVAARWDLGAVLLAHHRDDQDEATLLALARGGGLRALAGIPARRGLFHRPLVDLPRASLEAWATDHSLRWSEDSSNKSEAHLRNRIRHGVLPAFREAVPHLPAALARSRESLARDADYLDYMTGKALEEVRPEPGGATLVPWEAWSRWHRAIRWRVLLSLLEASPPAEDETAPARLPPRPRDLVPGALLESLVSLGPGDRADQTWGGWRVRCATEGLWREPCIVGLSKNSYLLDQSLGRTVFVAGGGTWVLDREAPPDRNKAVFMAGLRGRVAVIMPRPGQDHAVLLSEGGSWEFSWGDFTPRVRPCAGPESNPSETGMWLYGKGVLRE